MTSSERRQQARIAAYCQHATHDTRETTAAGRASFMATFDKLVDPLGVLAPDERNRRAAAARSAHFRKLALRSAQVRRARAAPAPPMALTDVPWTLRMPLEPPSAPMTKESG